MEQEFRRLAEEAERKYDALRTEFNAVLSKYNKMIDRLSEMAYENEALNTEVVNLKAFIADAGDEEGRDSTKKHSRGKFGSNGKEKSVKKDRTASNEQAKGNAQKIRSVG